MNLTKEKTASSAARQLSLDVFKDKMMNEVDEIQGGGSTAYCLGEMAGKAAREVWDWLTDDCHD